MRRNVLAAALQVVGLIAALIGAFSFSVPAGVIAVGVVLTILGFDLEGDG